MKIYEVIKLESLSGFRLVAGQLGLNRRITGTGILDYEFYKDIGIEINDPFRSGQLVLTSLLYSKNDESALHYAIRQLIDRGVSALAIKTIFLKELPESVRKLADQEQFPVFLFDNDIYFEDIISEIAMLVKKSDRLNTMERKLDRLIQKDLSIAEIRSITKELNNNFKRNLVAFFCDWDEQSEQIMPNQISNAVFPYQKHTEECSLFRYRSGLMVLISADSQDMSRFCAKFSDCMAYSGLAEDSFIIGYSSCRNTEEGIAEALKEAVWAYTACKKEGIRVAAFRETGIYQILLPHIESPWFESFRKDTIEPLENYDQKNGTELVKTAVAWIESQGSLKNTAKKLYVHENTVRYRMNRIHNLLYPNESEFVLYERIATAVRLGKLK